MSTLAREVMATEERLGILLAFQPVYTRNKTVAAYEVLLNRDSADCSDALPELTSSIVLGTYADTFQNGRIETVPTLLRVAPSTLLSPEITLLPQNQYILEIAVPENAPAELVAQLRALAERGYKLALGGYRPGRDDLESLLDVFEAVRLNLPQLGMPGLADAARRLYFHKTKLLVDGVDAIDQFYACADLGATWFQGDFLVKSTPVKDKKISNNKVLLLELLSELHRPDTSPMALEQIAIKDAAFSFRILKVINSAAVGLNREISSLSKAISLLGTNELGRWANMLLAHGEPGKPEELMRNMLVRGRMCEILAELSGRDDAMTSFIVGLLSRLDVLMDIAMRDLMRQVPLSFEVKQALLHRSGPLGELLTEVEHYESGRFDHLNWFVEPNLYEVAYRHSVIWARRAQQALEAT
ncbi:MAG TPA: HDOD domain-containing protein [Rhodanobacter sp.]|nr:HDOD domain-containing protein [Rhodanobacter sp.]